MDRKTVDSVARLARLTLTDAEADAFTHQFATLLNHFHEIAKIDTEGIEPLVHPTEIAVILREDKVENLFHPDQILSNAPEKSGDLFKVPPVV